MNEDNKRKELWNNMKVISIIIGITGLICLYVLYYDTYPDIRSRIWVTAKVEQQITQCALYVGSILAIIVVILSLYIRRVLKRDNYSCEENSQYEKHRSLINRCTLLSYIAYLLIIGAVFQQDISMANVELLGCCIFGMIMWQQSMLKDMVKKVKALETEDELEKYNHGKDADQVFTKLDNICICLCVGSFITFSSTGFCMGVVITCIVFRIIYRRELAKLGADMI